MSDEKREDLVVDLRGALGVLELSQTAGPFKADARDVAKKLASLQPILTRSGEWIDKCCNAAKKIGEATQDARERLADLECRIATLENAVAETLGKQAKGDAAVVRCTTASDVWFLTCRRRPNAYEWVEGESADGERFRAFFFDTVGLNSVWKNAELRTVDPPARWRSLPGCRPDGGKEDA